MVRSMVEAGNARAIMGNHEWNALQYHTIHNSGGYLRQRNSKNRNQHLRTLESYECEEDNISSDLENDLFWFYSLPLFFENQEFCAVHATWDTNLIKELIKSHPDGVIDECFLRLASEKGTREFAISDSLLKGQECELPEDWHFKDKDGNVRSNARIKWWMDPERSEIVQNRNPEDYLFIPAPSSRTKTMPALDEFPSYPAHERPVFFGHYWKRYPPQLEAPNVCCLDYSVARGGHLMAYRWDGSRILSRENLVYVPSE